MDYLVHRGIAITVAHCLEVKHLQKVAEMPMRALKVTTPVKLEPSGRVGGVVCQLGAQLRPPRGVRRVDSDIVLFC